MTLKKRRRLLRREPTNFTARAGMGEYRIKKRGESDNERKEMRSGTMQKEFDEIRKGASTIMKDTKKAPMPTQKSETKSSVKISKDDVASTKGKGATGTQSGPPAKGNQKKLDANKDGKLTAEDFRLLRNRKFRREEPEKYQALLKKRDGENDRLKDKKPSGSRVLTRRKNLERLRRLRELRKKQEEEKKKRKTDQRGRSR